jgi:hypothetical protein
MSVENIEQEEGFQWFINTKKEVYINELFGVNKIVAMHQLRSYRDELLKYLSLDSQKEILENLPIYEQKEKTKNLQEELSRIIQIINTHE